MNIGLIDSGLGAIGLLNELIKQKKYANYYLFIDYKGSPYGTKDDITLKQRYKIGENFLLLKKCEKIIISCNTLSKVAENESQKVITPIFYLQKKIDSIDGTLIATKYTISNNLYNCKNVLNCSNLVEYIEGRGQINKDFFNSFKGNLFLGCTHFTLVKNRFSNYCIDSVEELANNLAFTKSKLKINIYVTKLNKNIYNHILYYLHSTNFYIKLINI